jgi:hypothetical protein
MILELSNEQSFAVESILSHSDRNFLLCGIAGTGKSTVIAECVERLNYGSGEVLVTSMTGLAAEVVKGDTLHSAIGVGRVGLGDSFDDVWDRVRCNPLALSRLRKVRLLIIDEASLLSSQLFTFLEGILRLARNNSLGFGGVRIGLVGDFLQLPPFYDGLSEEQNRNMKGEWYCFRSPVWAIKFNPITFYLRQNQRTGDRDLGKFIEDLSEGRLSEEAISAFESRQGEVKLPEFFASENRGRMIISSLKSRVAGINSIMLNFNKSRLHFKAQNEFSHPSSQSNSSLLAKVSLLDEATVTRQCRVMFIQKHKVLATSDMRAIEHTSSIVTVRNGSMGTVVGFSDSRFVTKTAPRAGIIGRFLENASCNIESKKSKPGWYAAEVRLDSGWSFHVGMAEETVSVNTGETLRRLQVPFVVAYAATSHKCQGSTCEKLHVAISDGQLFEQEQFYVSVSRVRRLSELSIDPNLSIRSIPRGPSQNVKEFYSATFPREMFAWSTDVRINKPDSSLNNVDLGCKRRFCSISQ